MPFSGLQEAPDCGNAREGGAGVTERMLRRCRSFMGMWRVPERGI